MLKGIQHIGIWVLSAINIVLLVLIVKMASINNSFRKDLKSSADEYDEMFFEYFDSEMPEHFYPFVGRDSVVRKIRSYKDYPMPRECPVCKGYAVPIIYGLLTDSYFEDSLAVDLKGILRQIPGGCCVEDATWACADCDTRFVFVNNKLKKHVR